MRKEEAERKEQGNKNATSRCMVRDSCERKGRGSLLFSPSLLGGHDSYQTRPDSALASSSLAVRHFSWSHTCMLR